jgi:hypothetical protein
MASPVATLTPMNRGLKAAAGDEAPEDIDVVATLTPMNRGLKAPGRPGLRRPCLGVATLTPMNRGLKEALAGRAGADTESQPSPR